MAAGVDRSLRSSAGRSALLNLFQGAGTGVNHGGQPTRSRANRRHPDVGYLSRDPICLSCVHAALSGPSSGASTGSRAPERAAPPAESLTLPPAPVPAPVPAPDPLLEPSLSLLAVGEQEPVAVAVVGGPDPIPPPLFSPRQTPGPLPILGAGVAYGFSRRLRRRISAGRR